MSPTCSIPIESLMKSGVTPVASCSSAESCWCVVLAGWMASVLASPTFARCETSPSESMNFLPAASPPLMPKPTIAPAPCGR